MKYKGFGSSKVLGITVLPFYLFTFHSVYTFELRRRI